MGQGGVQALFNEALADALDGAQAAAEGLNNPGVLPGRAAVGLVGLEEDAGTGQRAGGAFPGGDELAQLLALFGGQGDEVFLVWHSRASFRRPRQYS